VVVVTGTEVDEVLVGAMVVLVVAAIVVLVVLVAAG
jgi:hypothetical protein